VGECSWGKSGNASDVDACVNGSAVDACIICEGREVAAGDTRDRGSVPQMNDLSAILTDLYFA
jgi:hypothetical protein